MGRFTDFSNYIKNNTVNSTIVNDTLKTWVKNPNNGGYYLKWSRTSLTMFVCFHLANWFAIHSFLKDGFHYEVFLTYLGIGVGLKTIDTIDKFKNKKTDTPPQGTTEEKTKLSNEEENI